MTRRVDAAHLADQADVDLGPVRPVTGGHLAPRGCSSPSLPERPTARPPWRLIRLTISLLILPTSTISTTSIVGCVGDAHAAHEVRLDAELFEHAADLRAAAVDDHRVDADVLQQHDVLREALLELVVGHRVAAVLDDDGLAGEAPDVRQRFEQDLGLVDQVVHWRRRRHQSSHAARRASASSTRDAGCRPGAVRGCSATDPRS